MLPAEWVLRPVGIFLTLVLVPSFSHAFILTETSSLSSGVWIDSIPLRSLCLCYKGDCCTVLSLAEVEYSVSEKKGNLRQVVLNSIMSNSKTNRLNANMSLASPNNGVCAQLCQTLCDPTSCSLPGSSVHGVFQARILGWVAIFSSREWIFLTQGLNTHPLGLLHWQAGSLPLAPPGRPHNNNNCIIDLLTNINKLALFLN